MKKLTAMVFLIVLTGAVSAQIGAEMDGVKEKVIVSALNYMEGGDFGDTERMAKAIHYELTKVTPTTIPQTGKTFLRNMGYTALMEAIRPAADSPPEKSMAKADVLAVKEGLAMVRVISDKFYDYLQMAEIAGEWKIINALWIFHPDFRKDPAAEPENIEADKAAVEAACMDYIEGSFSGDAERMEKALHPELTKVFPVKHPGTGRMMLQKMGAGSLIGGTEAKWGMVEEGKRNIEFKLLDIQRNIAFAEVLSSMYYDYCQLAKVNGDWKIVNVLWKMNPDAPVRGS